MSRVRSIITVLLVALVFAASAADIYDGLKNRKVDRAIDLKTQFARHTIDLDIVNIGSKAASEYLLAVPEKFASHLAFVDAQDEAGHVLKVSKAGSETKDKQSFELYKVEFAKALAPQDSVKVQVREVFSHSLSPFPTTIGQNEKQLVKYFNNHFFSSPYISDSQKTTVTLPTSVVEDRSQLSPSSASGSTVTYGPYSDVKAYSVNEMFLHFENNNAFITATSVVKEIEISHWGNVAVEETYELRHDGAKLKGHFSRFDYQRGYRMGGNVVTSFKQVLPEGAADIYYRDEIGNISTSNLIPADEGLVMDVVPRFPLFGGWAIGFYFGYNLPSAGYLGYDYNDASRYVLNLTFASHFNETTIDELTVRVILPEGASEIDYHVPFGIDAQTWDKHYTYLDTSGRPVLILKKYNVVPEHNQFFQVVYRFSSTSLLREPILLIGAYFFFFLFIMLWTRIPTQIGGTRSRVGNEKIESLLFKVKDLNEQKAEQYEAVSTLLENCINTGKSEKEFTAARKSFAGKFLDINKQLADAVTVLETLSSEWGKKAKDVQTKENNKSDIFGKLVDLEVDYKLKRDLSKTEYDGFKTDLDHKLQAANEELDALVSDIADAL